MLIDMTRFRKNIKKIKDPCIIKTINKLET